jgi:hypothetical protein
MITVELDIFSGNPNPRWTLTNEEAKELMDRALADPSLTLPPKSVGGLGYRGFTVLVGEDSKERLVQAGLSSKFYVSARQEPDAEKWLLNTRDSGRSAADNVLQVAKEMIESTNQAWSQLWSRDSIADASKPALSLSESLAPVVGDLMPNIAPGTPSPDESPATVLACGEKVVESDTDFSFWNDSTMPFNNCYNFAAGWKSNTFAQPGRKSNIPFSSFDCANVPNVSIGYAAAFDGFTNACWDGRQYYASLVIWPGVDFHWYRECANGHWCHKPGQTPARNYDESGSWITNPLTCNRGPYTEFCSFRYFPYGWTVS